MNNRGRHAAPARRRGSRAVVLALSLALAAGCAAGGTVAWLADETEDVVNTFEPAKVGNEIVEEFDGTAKTSIKVENTGDVEAYVRVKLVTYRVDDGGNRIGGEAVIPTFSLGGNWFEQGGYYYYEGKVAIGGQTGDLIASGSKIELESYSDADGGKQVIEVLSESIQTLPATAVEEAWGVVVDPDGKLTVADKTA